MPLKRITYIILLLVSVTHLSAQQFRIDSLNAILKNCKTDTGKINTLNTLSSLYADMFNRDSSLKMAFKANDLAMKTKYKPGEARSLILIGQTYSLEDFADKGIIYATKGFKLYKKLKNNHGRTIAYITIARAYYHAGDFTNAIKYYNKALQQGNDEDYDKIRARIEIGLGNVYNACGNRKQAVTHYNAVLKMIERNPDIPYGAVTYNNLGDAYLLLHDTVTAFACCNKALALAEKSTDAEEKCNTYTSIAYLYALKNDTSVALKYVSSAIKTELDSNYAYKRIRSLNYLANIYRHFKDTTNAVLYYTQASKLCDSIKFPRGNAELCVNLGDMCKGNDSATKVRYYNNALLTEQRLHLKDKEADTYHHIANYYSHMSDIALLREHYDAAVDSEINAYKLFLDMGDINGQALAAISVGNIDLWNGKPVQALNYFARALKLTKKYPELSRQMAISMDGIGYSYFEQNDTLRAINYFAEAKKLQEDSNYKNDIWLTYKHLAIYYVKEQNLNRAMSYYGKALETVVAVKEYSAVPELEFQIASVYEWAGDTINEFTHYCRSAQASEAVGTTFDVAKSYYKIAALYRRSKEYKEAERFYHLALSAAKKSNAQLIQMFCYYELYEVFLATGRAEEASESYDVYRAIMKKVKAQR